ncbi:MAG: type 1 glutamine amidotransferase [Bacteroidales bacterium]
MKKKVLVYNIMEFPEKIRIFREGIEREVNEAGIDARFVLPEEPTLPLLREECTHLIISGSEASAKDESPWTEELAGLIRYFLDNDKKILAICYGHQFLARVLAGKECVYKLPVPEYGYSRVYLKENPLFAGIMEPVVVQLHYDAVRNLPARFEIIADNEISLQAYQYDGRDVYGVQFHPEFNREAAEYFLDETRKSDPDFSDFYRNELSDRRQLDQNGLFIRNFLKM